MEEYVYQGLQLYYPSIFDRVVEWKSTGVFSIIVKLDDGTIGIYDAMDNSFRYLEYDPENMTDEEFIKEFGIRLKQRMRHYGITQDHLCELTGIKRSTISDYILGKTNPSLVNTRKIANALNCSINDITYFGY